MIYSYNTLGFYTTKTNRQYDNTGNIRVLHHFETNKIPAFQLIIVSAETFTASYELFDIDDTLVSSGSVTVEEDTNEAGTVYRRLIFLGATLASKEDGFYWIKITYDTDQVIYSDVFCWQTDVSDYLRIEAKTWADGSPSVYANMMIGEFELNMANSFAYLVYLNADESALDYETEEEGVEKTYGNIPLFSSRNKISEFEITGYRITHDFLAGLRQVWTNGVVTLTYKGDEFDIYDMENPEKNSSYNYSATIVLGFRFKRKDYLQSKNSI